MSTGMIVLIVFIAVAVVLAGLAAVAVPAFHKMQEKAQQIKKQQEPALKPPAPLTAEQKKALEQFGRDLAQALTAKNSEKVVALQDGEGLAARVFEKLPAGVPNSADMRAGFVQGTKNRAGGWMWSVMSGDVGFLRTRERLGFPAVLLRIKSEEGAVNYVDVLVRPDGGSFKAVDLFNYVFATTVSEESRNVLAAMVSKSAGGGLAAMLGMPKMDESIFSHLDSINKATRTGDMAAVLRICDGLPQDLKTTRLFFILRLQALMSLNSTGSEKIDTQYEEALRAAPDILGKDSTSDLLMVDLLLMENDFKGAEECLKRVDAAVGGDPYLKFLRGGVHIQMKDYDGALEMANQAEKEDPKMADAVDLRLTVHLERKDYKALADELRAFKRNFGKVLNREALATNEAYNEFLASPEFAAWEKEIAKP